MQAEDLVLHFPFVTTSRSSFRSVVRVTRRYHVIDRISRRLGSLGSGNSGPQVASGHSGPQATSGPTGPQAASGHSGPQAAGGHQPASANGNGINSPPSTYSNSVSANGNGVNVNGNGAQHQPAPVPRRESRVPPLHDDPTVFLRAELNGHHHQAPSTRLGRYSRYLNGGEGRGGNLEKQLLLQQAEICSLREGLKQQYGLKSRANSTKKNRN